MEKNINNIKAAIVEGLPEDVLLGMDVPLHKHLVKRLPDREQMELLHQLAKDHQVEISGISGYADKIEGGLAVVTPAQKTNQKSMRRYQPKKQQRYLATYRGDRAATTGGARRYRERRWQFVRT